MQVILKINCPDCDEEIKHDSLHLSDEEVAEVNVDEFSQTDWVCENCGRTFCIGDIDIINLEDLL